MHTIAYADPGRACRWQPPHLATFRGPDGPATKPIPLAKMLRPYRREAIAGINYAWGHGYVAPDDCDDAGRMENPLPPRQHMPRKLPKDSPLVSKNNKRLPLRAFAWRELNRRFWSKGEVLFADKLERSEPEELTLFEKTVDPSTMTFEELRDTQHLEPLSESRRSWLVRGAGVLALEGVRFLEGSIGEIAQAKGQFPGIVTAMEPGFADESSSVGRGVPYVFPDPITAKQIDYERRVHGNSEVVRVKINAKEDGGLSLAMDRKLLPEPLMRLARSVKRTLADDRSEWDSVAHRFRLIGTEAERLGFAYADADEERQRLLDPVDDLWHHSYVEVQPTVAILAPWPCDGFFCSTRDCYCNRPGCTTVECHRHLRLERKVHRSIRRGDSEFWRGTLFDVTAFELGTDGLVDALAVTW